MEHLVQVIVRCLEVLAAGLLCMPPIYWAPEQARYHSVTHTATLLPGKLVGWFSYMGSAQ
jgi:hypothetical protein